MGEFWGIWRRIFGDFFGHFGLIFKATIPSWCTLFAMGLIFYQMAPTSLGDYFFIAGGAFFFFGAVVISGTACSLQGYFLRNQNEITWWPFRFDWRKAVEYFSVTLILVILWMGFSIVAGSVKTIFWLAIGIKPAIYSLTYFSFNCISNTIIFYVLLRASLILPAVAVGADKRIADVWSATGHHNVTFWCLALCVSVAISAYVTITLFAIGTIIINVQPKEFFATDEFWDLFMRYALIFSSIYGGICYIFGTLILTETYRAIFEENIQSKVTNAELAPSA